MRDTVSDASLVQATTHHLDIRRRVAMSGGNLRMPEPRLNRQKVYTRLQQDHCEGVPEDVRRDLLSREFGHLLGCYSNGAVHDMDSSEAVSEACRALGYSRDTFYRLKRRFDEAGLEGLKEISRRKPNRRNRVAAEIEDAVIELAVEYPAYGQVRAAAKLFEIKQYQLSPDGIRGIWQRNGLETKKKRLQRLEEKVAAEGCVLTESQLQALEAAQQEKEAHGEIETEHPGYLGSRDTFYVGTMKGVGRIYQQTFVDTYSRVAFCKLYTMKTPITAADLLNDRVLPFLEEHDVPLLRILTDRGTEYCGNVERHEYQLYLVLNDIDHSKTKAKSPQTNGICERFHKTILEEFYQVALRKKIYRSVDELQVDLDTWLVEYNHRRPHQGKRCDGKTPFDTFVDGKMIVEEKKLCA